MRELRVVKYKALKDRHARRGTPAIKAGTPLSLIADIVTGKYFVWAYQNEEMAQIVCKRLQENWRPTDIDFNFTSSREKALHTNKSPNSVLKSV